MKRVQSIATVLALTAVVLFSYQNCGVETPQSMFDAVHAYKLPYEVKVDQVVYMSCAEQQNIPNPSGVFFSFRLGAYGSQAGLRLSDNFLYETRYDNQQNRAIKLTEEYVSVDQRVEFSIRSQTDLSAMYMNNTSSQGIEGQDYDFVFGDLGSNAMNASLVYLKDSEYLNYWSAGGITPDAYMQGSMVFNSSESLASNLRTFLTNDGLLTVGFANPTDPSKILTREGYDLPYVDDDGDGQKNDTDDDVVPANQAYGVGLKVSFKQPLPSNWGYTNSGRSTPHPSLPKRVLASVYEYDLTSPQKIQAQWNCPIELQLRVVYPTDRDYNDPYPFATARKLCPAAPDPVTQPDLANFQIVRRSLPASDWDINWSRRCVVPKNYTKGSCYGIDAGVSPSVTRSPVYDFTQACDPAINPACLHFVSVCVKP